MRAFFLNMERESVLESSEPAAIHPHPSFIGVSGAPKQNRAAPAQQISLALLSFPPTQLSSEKELLQEHLQLPWPYPDSDCAVPSQATPNRFDAAPPFLTKLNG